MNLNVLKLKIIAYCYRIACKIYQGFVTCYENKFIQIRSPDIEFSSKGLFKIPFLKEELLNDSENFNLVKVNDYLYLRDLSTKQISILIKKIFTKDIRKQITYLTGFNFSVDFMIIYDRKYIPRDKREVSTLKQVYSYRWHFDKPNSSNMLKIFIPINISNEHGPLEVIDKINSRKIKDCRNIDNTFEKILFKGKKDFIYGFYPTLCCHRDGIPNRKLIATQIMFQLNPNKKWVINSKLFSKRKTKNNKFGIWTTEPKFPFFTYFFDKKFDLINF